MSEAIDRAKWFWKNDPILSRFSFEFSEKVKTNPICTHVFKLIAEIVGACIKIW
jgi:hypothetical protein